MDEVKEAFQKVKQDISFLDNQLSHLNSESSETRKRIGDLCEIIKELSEKVLILNKKIDLNNTKTPTDTPTHQSNIPTNTYNIPTHNHLFKPQYTQNKPFSTGNWGVPTDRQTNQQTNQQTENTHKTSENPPKNSIENAVEILDSLDNLKKEIRLKFKKLTDQEILVFSTIYQLEEELKEVNYKAISDKLNLTESSIRDYVGKLIKKGIPVEKNKINNKNILLSISSNLKKIATLPTILKLRDI